MQINSSTGISFKLNILGYEYPHITDQYWDSNWLSTQINVVHPKGAWSAVDHCLTTLDVEQLANWFEDIHSNSNRFSNCSFIEPYLEFEIKTNENNFQMLYIYFEFKLLPKWGYSKGIGYRSFWIEFLLAEIDLLKVAKDLRLELEKYPQRVFR